MQWSGQPVDDGDQGVEDGWDVAGHVVAQLDRDLARRPGGVVAHADVLRVQVARKDRHELWEEKKILESIKDVRTWYARVDVREARLGEVAQQSKTWLPHLWHRVLKEERIGEDLVRASKLNVIFETSWRKI